MGWVENVLARCMHMAVQAKMIPMSHEDLQILRIQEILMVVYGTNTHYPTRVGILIGGRNDHAPS